MEIHEMTLEDLELIKDTLYSEYDNFWSYNILKNELLNDKTTYIVAKENNQIVGFAGIMTCLDEATLNNIVVKKTCRGRGIGGELLDSIIELCADLNMKTLTLEVDSSNIPAINLYKKFGFKNLGTRKKYYNHASDAIIMTKYDI